MVKLVFRLHRLPHLSREAFQRYWRKTHGPLVRAHAPTLRVRRYVQLHTAEHPVNASLRGTRGGPEACDGVAELWWDSFDDLAAVTGSDEGRAAALALLEDERGFVDLARSPLFAGEEHEVVAA